MSGDDQIAPPAVIWAQRPSHVLVTVCLEDCKKPDIKITNDKLYFKGLGGTDKKLHEVTINFYNEINAEESIHCVQDRIIEFVLKKKEAGPFWPRLTKDKVKYHWLKVDFNKWVDEDDLGADEDKWEDVEKMLANMGVAGENQQNNLSDLQMNSMSSDDDDDDLPDLE